MVLAAAMISYALVSGTLRTNEAEERLKRQRIVDSEKEQ